MKKIAFVFVAAIATSFAVSMSSCSEGNKAQDSTCCGDSACDSLCTEVVEDTTANDTLANDTLANDSIVAPEA